MQKIDEILNAEKYDYSIQKSLEELTAFGFSPLWRSWMVISRSSKFIDKEKADYLYHCLKSDIENYIMISSKN